jgi:hypothetical protein
MAGEGVRPNILVAKSWYLPSSAQLLARPDEARVTAGGYRQRMNLDWWSPRSSSWLKQRSPCQASSLAVQYPKMYQATSAQEALDVPRRTAFLSNPDHNLGGDCPRLMWRTDEGWSSVPTLPFVGSVRRRSPRRLRSGPRRGKLRRRVRVHTVWGYYRNGVSGGKQVCRRPA